MYKLILIANYNKPVGDLAHEAAISSKRLLLSIDTSNDIPSDHAADAG